MEYETIIGLEFHAQLLCRTKLFCSCPSAFGAPPNTCTCAICLGLPGILPVLNRHAVDLGIRIALAVHSEVAEFCRFARKNYFYPDLPKGYQISQYEQPLASGGYFDFEFEGQSRRVGIVRAHLEEDAGKLVHSERGESLVDYNRCGVALMEIVSAPDLRSPAEARVFMTALRNLLRHIGVCDGDLERGNMRCDANISVRPKGSAQLFNKTEIKNVNSFKFVQQALEFEQARHIQLHEQGAPIPKESRTFDHAAGVTRVMRVKEEADDYRYFPEPDLIPVEVDRAWVERVRAELPELPAAMKARFLKQFGVSDYEAGVLTETKELAAYYEETVQAFSDAKMASNWVLGEVMRLLKVRGEEIERFPIRPPALAALLKLTAESVISHTVAKEVFAEMVETRADAAAIVARRGLAQISDTAKLEEIAAQIIAENPAETEIYKSGKPRILGFFVGELMKRSGRMANPKLANEILRKLLDRP